MKKLHLLCCLLIVYVTGCRSSVELKPQPTDTPTIVGDWVWTTSSGGFGGAIFKPASGEEIILRFSADKQLAILRNNVIIRQGSYSQGTARSIYTSKDAQTITIVQLSTVTSAPLPPLAFNGVLVALTVNELSIGDNIYDGYGSNYRRK